MNNYRNLKKLINPELSSRITIQKEKHPDRNNDFIIKLSDDKPHFDKYLLTIENLVSIHDVIMAPNNPYRLKFGGSIQDLKYLNIPQKFINFMIDLEKNVENKKIINNKISMCFSLLQPKYIPMSISFILNEDFSLFKGAVVNYGMISVLRKKENDPYAVQWLIKPDIFTYNFEKDKLTSELCPHSTIATYLEQKEKASQAEKDELLKNILDLYNFIKKEY